MQANRCDTASDHRCHRTLVNVSTIQWWRAIGKRSLTVTPHMHCWFWVTAQVNSAHGISLTCNVENDGRGSTFVLGRCAVVGIRPDRRANLASMAFLASIKPTMHIAHTTTTWSCLKQTKGLSRHKNDKRNKRNATLPAGCRALATLGKIHHLLCSARNPSYHTTLALLLATWQKAADTTPATWGHCHVIARDAFLFEERSCLSLQTQVRLRRSALL